VIDERDDAGARAPLRANTVEVEAWGVAAVRGVGGCGVEQAAGGGSAPRPPGVVLLSGFKKKQKAPFNPPSFRQPPPTSLGGGWRLKVEILWKKKNLKMFSAF